MSAKDKIHWAWVYGYGCGVAYMLIIQMIIP